MSERAKQFKQWCSERMGHSYPVQLAKLAVEELEDERSQLQQDKTDLEESISYYKNKVKDLEFMIENGLGWEDMKGGNIEDVM